MLPSRQQLTSDHEPACMCHLYRLRIKTHVLNQHHALCYRATLFTLKYDKSFVLKVCFISILSFTCRTLLRNIHIYFFLYIYMKENSLPLKEAVWGKKVGMTFYSYSFYSQVGKRSIDGMYLCILFVIFTQ